MKISIERVFKGEEYTIGKLYIDGQYFCDTLEDRYRDLTIERKVKGETCIPCGEYPVTLNIQSPKYKSYDQYKFCNGYLPRLLNVPYFEGILIHIGNYPRDTEGCILVGRNTVKGAVMESTVTFKKLYHKLKEATDDIIIEIK